MFTVGFNFPQSSSSKTCWMIPRIRLVRVQSVVITLNKPGHRQGHETRTVLYLCVYGTLQISDWTNMRRPRLQWRAEWWTRRFGWHTCPRDIYFWCRDPIMKSALKDTYGGHPNKLTPDIHLNQLGAPEHHKKTYTPLPIGISYWH